MSINFFQLWQIRSIEVFFRQKLRALDNIYRDAAIATGGFEKFSCFSLNSSMLVSVKNNKIPNQKYKAFQKPLSGIFNISPVLWASIWDSEFTEIPQKEQKNVCPLAWPGAVLAFSFCTCTGEEETTATGAETGTSHLLASVKHKIFNHKPLT